MRSPSALVASLAVAPMALWLGWTTGWLLDPGQWPYTPAYRVPIATAPPTSSPRSELAVDVTETVTLTATPPTSRETRTAVTSPPPVAETTSGPPTAAVTSTSTPTPTDTTPDVGCTSSPLEEPCSPARSGSALPTGPPSPLLTP